MNQGQLLLRGLQYSVGVLLGHPTTLAAPPPPPQAHLSCDWCKAPVEEYEIEVRDGMVLGLCCR